MRRSWQFFLENGTLWGRKSVLLLLMVLALGTLESCSKKMPCPDVEQAATSKPPKGKKKKKVAKVRKTDENEDPDNMETASASIEEPTDAKATQKAAISTKKNKYNKNGLLQKKKYKRLRSKPNRKVSRRKKGGFFGLFSGNKKNKSKAPKSKPSVGPVDDEL